MIDQNKGKDLDNIAKSKLVDGPYYLSKKKDGHYVQIKYDIMTDEVNFWTSGGKPFYIKHMADYIRRKSLSSFHIECEYNYNCEGKLGERGKSAILTTYRKNYEKGIETKGEVAKDFFTVLDIVNSSVTYETRVRMIKDMFFDLTEWFVPSYQTYVATLEEAQEVALGWYKQGWEGGMGKHPKHIYQPGKRTNDIIKFKPRQTADLYCVDVEEGKGKYAKMIGALVLEDSQGRRVSVGSGLTDDDRAYDYFVGQVIEISYEQILDTYIQPTFIQVRTDKSKKDIT